MVWGRNQDYFLSYYSIDPELCIEKFILKPVPLTMGLYMYGSISGPYSRSS